MAFGESLRPYPKISQEEVFELTGRAESVIELKKSNFEGPVAHWANDRMRQFGETIISRIVYVEQPPYKKPHRVAWVYHEGFSDSGEPFCIHHVACDCSGDVDRVESHEEKQEVIDNCPALIPVINKQAELVSTTYCHDEILRGLSYDTELPMEEQTPEIQNFIARSMVHILERDYRHPESWMANVESGWMLINLLSKVLKIRPEDVDWLAKALAAQDSAETDGTHICLSQQQKELIEMDKKFHEIVDGVELNEL